LKSSVLIAKREFVPIAHSSVIIKGMISEWNRKC